jgi:hypothetical protein
LKENIYNIKKEKKYRATRKIEAERRNIRNTESGERWREKNVNKGN